MDNLFRLNDFLTNITRVSVPVLERSLLVEIRHLHRKCKRGFIFPEGHPDQGCCANCRMTGDGRISKPLPVDQKDWITMFFYRLPNGQLYGTIIGIWNQN